jgi:hypothetical protein
VTTSRTWIVRSGTSEGIRALTVTLTVLLAFVTLALALTSLRKVEVDEVANEIAAWAPLPGGGCEVRATSAPCLAAASTESLARNQIEAWTMVMIPIRKTGTMST